MYLLCVGQGWVSPSEFWAMPPGELWWLVDAKTSESRRAESNVDALIDMLDAAIAAEKDA